MGNSIITTRGPGVRVVAGASTWIEGEALRQLDAAAALPGMTEVVGMPDLHPGKGGPVGAAFLSAAFLYPALVGADIGCGMGLWATDRLVRKARPERLAERLEGLDTPWDGDTGAWLAAHGQRPTAYDVSLGTPGRGNHFIELQLVADIIDAPALAGLGLARERLALLVHSGSRGLGEAVLRAHAEQHGAAPVAAASEAGLAYLAAHDAAVGWAAANRALCASRICAAIGADAAPVLDLSHNAVSAMEVAGCRCWLHRKGAAPADQGPVVIPGSRGDLSWLVRPVPGNEAALRSLAHGAGRKIARHEARAKLRPRYQREDLRRNPWGGRVVCGEEMLAWEEAAACYKPIASVVGDLEAAGLITRIASLRPLVTFKTSEGAKVEADDGWRQERHEARRAKAAMR